VGNNCDYHRRKIRTAAQSDAARFGSITRIQKINRKTFEPGQRSRRKATAPVSEVVIAAIEDTGYSKMLREENSDESESGLKIWKN
jgi:hypothetical protein